MDRVHVNLSDWQKKVWKDDKRYIVVNCGRRAGKTTVVAWKLFYLATQKENQILWYVAPTYKQAKQILWEMLVEMIPKEAIEKRNETELKIVLKNKSRIEVKGADNVDSLRGVRIDFAVFDECAFIDKWDLVWKVMRPTLVDSKARCMFISTPNGFNHFRELSYNETKDGGHVFLESDHSYHHFTSYDNPYLDRTELDTIKREMNEDAFEQEMMGEFRKMSGLIYKEFKREIHMVDIPFDRFDTNWTYTRSLDFGFGHKSSLGYYAISPDQNEIYRYDGLYVSGFNEAQIADVVRTKDQGRYITYPVADSAQPMAISELQAHGVDFNPVVKGRDSVKAGITKVAELLKVRNDTGKPTLMFNRHHSYVADEMERYRWIENKNDKSLIREIPYKANDDFCDECRYMAMSFKVRDKIYRPYNRNSWGIQ
jgi:PBSX family phage terminase large subunit